MTGGWDPLLRDAAAGRKREGESKWRRACVCCCFSLQRLLCFMTKLGFRVAGCVGEVLFFLHCNFAYFLFLDSLEGTRKHRSSRMVWAGDEGGYGSYEA